MDNLPLHSHTEHLEKIKKKVNNSHSLNIEDILFLFETIEQLEGELAEWIVLYEENIKRK